MDVSYYINDFFFIMIMKDGRLSNLRRPHSIAKVVDFRPLFR